MSNNNNFIPPFSNETLFSLMEKYNGMPDAFRNLVDIQVENMRSIGKVQQSSLENIQKLASRQQGVFSQIMKNTTTMANDVIENLDPKAALKVSADNLQKSYEATSSSVNEISDLLQKSSTETNNILRDSAKQSLNELQNVQQKVNDAS